MEQNSTRCHSSAEQDTLYIETEKAEFEIIYRLCLNQQGRKNVVYELKTSDDSSIDFVQSYMVNGIRKLDCFVVYDNVADGNRFLFYDYESRVIHMTPACFSDFYPICSSADFSKGEVLLINGHSHLTYIIHSGFISGYQNRYGDNLKPPTNVYHRMTA